MISTIDLLSSSLCDPVLSRLLEEISDKLQRGEPVELQAYCDQHPEHAETLERLVPSIEVLAQWNGDDSGDSPDRLTSGRPLGDFRLIREIGRGGMGVVYEAEQLSLRRKVALKVLPFAAVMDPNHLRRFQNEAQAAALLHHPHIVPVHAIGSDRGIHYFAMQLIEGRSVAELLSDQARQLESNGRSDAKNSTFPGDASFSSVATVDTVPLAELATLPTTSRSQAIRQVARLGIEGATALQYAHSQGVVHRDIKPGNLLIDQSGSLWIADFGLASINNELSITASHELIGTLRYMSPEQVSGTGTVDHRSDVYSLGITLYELLTLQKAVPGDTRQAILNEIVNVEPTIPSRLVPELPTDLETIVLKAIAKDPADRYQSAQELADDLQRYLQHQPIQAKRPTRLQRVSKWCIRHRGLTATVAIALCAVSLLSLIGTLLVSSAYRSEAAQRQRAEVSLQMAVDAIDQVYGEFIGNDLSDTLVLTPQQERFLSIAGQLYEELAAKTGKDATQWGGYLELPMQRARVYRRLGKWNAAEQVLREAIPAYQQAIDEVTGTRRIGREGQLALLEQELASVLVRQGRPDEAETYYRQAIARIQSTPLNVTTQDAVQYSLQSAQLELATLVARQGNFDEADMLLAASESLCRELLKRPHNADIHGGLAGVYRERAEISLQRGQSATAIESAKAAIEHDQQAVDLDPKNQLLAANLLTDLHLLGASAEQDGNVDAEIDAYERAVELALRRRDDDPTELLFIADLAESYVRLAGALTTAGRDSEAATHVQTAQDLLSPIIETTPELTIGQRTAFGKAFYNLSFFFESRNVPAPARFFLEHAVGYLSEAVAVETQDTVVREYLAKARYNLGMNMVLEHGSPQDALAVWTASVADWQELVDAHPYQSEYASRLGATLSNIARLYLNNGDIEHARTLVDEAIRHQQRALSLSPPYAMAAEFMEVHRRLEEKIADQ